MIVRAIIAQTPDAYDIGYGVVLKEILASVCQLVGGTDVPIDGSEGIVKTDIEAQFVPCRFTIEEEYIDALPGNALEHRDSVFRRLLPILGFPLGKGILCTCPHR